MMRRNTSAVARLIPVYAAADADTISESGSSTTAPPPQPGRRLQTESVLHAVHAAAVEEVTSRQLVEGGLRASGAAINRFLRDHGWIPVICTCQDAPALDLNALAPPDDARQPAPRVHPPLVCAYCNCAFCFSEHEVPALDLGPEHVYPAPPVPLTLDLLTPPAVAPLHRDGAARGTPAAPARLLVCSCEQHFKATMGMLQQQRPGGAPSLLWLCAGSCLNVLPVVVGSEGSSSDLRAAPAPPPPEPHTYAGAYWNYVLPGHEDLVELRLHNDPLMLTLRHR